MIHKLKQNKWLIIWAVASIVYAIVIHILFHCTGPDWLVAKWEAGDILTYTSTVSLGLLAVWQNKKFKEESDTAQDRMEKLTIRANELSAIAKIIECEKTTFQGYKLKPSN
jgi:hypothetical protein